MEGKENFKHLEGRQTGSVKIPGHRHYFRNSSLPAKVK